MYERMLDKTSQPTWEEMTAFCGDRAALFEQLNGWLETEAHTQPKVVFPYGNHYGWGIGHYKKKKLICNIFPENGAFTVMLRLSDAQFWRIYPIMLPYTQAYIDKRYPCGDGGWVHYRVLEQAHMLDVKGLLSAKCYAFI